MPKYLGHQSRDHIQGHTLADCLLCLKRLLDNKVWSDCGCTAPVRRRRESVGRRQDQLATERACTKRNWSHRGWLPTALTSRCATSSIGERPGYLEHITVWEMFPLISTFFVVIALIPITVASNLMMESIQDTTDLSWKYSAAFARSRSSYKRVVFIGSKRSNVQMLPKQIFKIIKNVRWMSTSLTCCQLLHGNIEI